LFLITTSHRSSPRVRSLVKDLVSVFPGALRVQRGHRTLNDLAVEAYVNRLKYVLLVGELHGNPKLISIYEVLEEPELRLVKIVDLLLKGVKLSRENPSSARIYGVETLSINYSKCISSDCYLLADVLTKIFQPRISENPDITVILDEEKYIEVKFQGVHGKLVGPVLRVLRVVKSGDIET